MNSSATTKALDKMKSVKEGKEARRRRMRKNPHSTQVLKSTINRELWKIIKPKNASSLLHNLKPDCNFSCNEDSHKNPSRFTAHVKQNNSVLASGEGSSEKEAKNAAAENVFKLIVLEKMIEDPSDMLSDEEISDGEFRDKDNVDALSKLPWLELLSLAIFKMFSSWKEEIEIELKEEVKNELKEEIKNELKDDIENKLKEKCECISAEIQCSTSTTFQVTSQRGMNTVKTLKQLPVNATNKHPMALLNETIAGLTAVELINDLNHKIFKMGFEVDGIMHTGHGRTKKEAKKEAAKAVLHYLFEFSYPPNSIF